MTAVMMKPLRKNAVCFMSVSPAHASTYCAPGRWRRPPARAHPGSARAFSTAWCQSLAMPPRTHLELPARNAAAYAMAISMRPPTKRSEEHTSELQSRFDLVCRLLLVKKKLDAASRTIQVPRALGLHGSH